MTGKAALIYSIAVCLGGAAFIILVVPWIIVFADHYIQWVRHVGGG
jgi:hypothetical protein